MTVSRAPAPEEGSARGRRPEGLDLRPLDEEGRAALQALVREPSLCGQFELRARAGGVDDALADPHLDREGGAVACLDGEAAGFRLGLVLPSAEGPWAMLWLGVAERFRRRGIGSRLLAGALVRLESDPVRPLREVCVAAWLPNDAARAFARGHGFRPARTFWLMERPLGSPAAPVWPAGIEVRAFDGSERALADWNRVYNESFARHYHFVPSTVEDCRALVGQSRFAPAALLLAYRGGRCVGFAHSTLLGRRGEVAAVGVAPDARGVGLGRALLRAGARWLEEQGAPRVTLLVDGGNEDALRLYGREGFEVARTRELWSRPRPPAGLP